MEDSELRIKAMEIVVANLDYSDEDDLIELSQKIYEFLKGHDDLLK